MTQEIVYVKHPITKSEKEKHIRDGKKILDIKFKPKEAKVVSKPKSAATQIEKTGG